MDEYNTFNNIFQKSNQVLRNAQIGPSMGSVAPPIPNLTTMPTPPLAPPNAPAAGGSGGNNNTLQRGYRRNPVPMQYGLPPTSTVYSGGAYNNHPYNRPYMNMNMNLGGGYSPYSSYRQPISNQYQNPVILAAAENSRPAFESIQSVVQTFNSVSMMLESTFTAMHISFEALLGVAENFTRLRMFMIKLYSTIVSFKLARWFLTKLFYLLRMVKDRRTPDVDENLWAALSSTTLREIMPSDGRSWPLVVFTGILVATPYFVYKLLNSVTPVSNSIDTLNPNNATSISKVAIRAQNNWSSPDPKTISLEKGKMYYTYNSWMEYAAQNGGWLYVENSSGQKGYVPLVMFRTNKIVPPPPPPPPSVHQNVMSKTLNVISQVIPPNNPEQIKQQLPLTTTDEYYDSILLSNPLVNGINLENEI